MAKRLPYVYVSGETPKLARLVEDEIDQLKQEGFDVSECEKRFSEAQSDPDALKKLKEDLKKCDVLADFAYDEPSDWETIEADQPGPAGELSFSLDEPGLYDRVYGGWLGRCAGNLLGRPVENRTRGEIEEWLRLAGSYPLDNYFPPLRPIPDEAPDWLKNQLSKQDQSGDLLGQIDGMVRDDDLDYTIIGLHILEKFGSDFTTKNVGDAWLNLFPFRQVHTAERVAYINLVNGIPPPQSAVHSNPYREWIGAQIRADMWGYVTPGQPRRGAEMAYRDAQLSHTQNGIYGEMFVSSMISSAFCTQDPRRIIENGLAVVPQRSRLASAIREVMDLSERHAKWQDAWKTVDEKYGHYHPVHVINNAAVVALGLLYGRGDFERSAATTVMCGFDTDCNGATVGSILGIMLGADALPQKWIGPIDDSLRSYVMGYDNSRPTDLAKRTVEQARALTG
jgi:ADP-ribosylglycohydrolase